MKQVFSKGMVLGTIILMDILTGIEFDLFVPSFPELQNHFGLSVFWVESLLSANFVGYFLSLFFVGGLADRYGRKPMILFGLAIFILGSMACLWAPHFGVMLVGRFLQGIGIAAPAILSFLIIADAYPLKKQQSLFAVLNGLFNIAAGIAPVIGSYIALYFHWQGNFKTLLILGVCAFIMTVFFIPAYKLPTTKEPLSLKGYLPIFQSKPLVLLILHIVFSFVPYWVFVGMSPLLYMTDLSVSLNHFGYYQGLLAFAFAIGSLAFGAIVAKHDMRKMLKIAFQIYISGLVVIALITYQNSSDPQIITLAFLPFILGGIIPSVILQPLSLSLIPSAKGRISAVLQGGRLMFAALFLQLTGYLYNQTFQNIGIVLSLFIFLTVLSLYFVIHNKALMTAERG